MITPQNLLGYVKADPFRPFRIHMASGRTFDVRHPEMIKVLKSYALVFKAVGDNPDLPDEHESVSLMLANPSPTWKPRSPHEARYVER